MPSSKSIDYRLQEFVRYAEVRQMAYNIIAMQKERRFRSLAVISFFPGEGRTLFCAALAMAYSEASSAKTLIIDTTSFQNKKSLHLEDCFNAQSNVDLMSLEDLRSSEGPRIAPAATRVSGGSPVIDPDIVEAPWAHVSATAENDFSLIRRATEEESKRHRLVLMDTVPLSVRNRKNVDPLLVARTCDASVLVAGRRLLESRNLNVTLKTLADPSLHLIGMISNEEYRR